MHHVKERLSLMEHVVTGEVGMTDLQVVDYTFK